MVHFGRRVISMRRLDAFGWDRSIHPSIRPLAVGIYELFTSASLIIFSAWSQSSSALVD